MLVRKLTPQEHYRAHLVQAVAFEGNCDYQKEKEEAEKQAEQGAPQRADTWMWGSFSDDESVLYGCMNIRQYSCHFDGGEVFMGGVGGVASLPQYRRNGAIRATITAALQDMYEKGFAFSFLYPFSTQYYRKFGYEVGAQAYRWTLPLSDLPGQDVGGTVEQLLPGDSTQPLLDIYREFYRDYNLAAHRAVFEEELEKENLINQQRYIFVWRDETGKARSFLICHKKQEAEGAVMDCTNDFPMRNGLLFLDARALQGLFYFIKTAFPAYYQKIRFTVPGSIPLASMVGENNTAHCQLFFNTMIRAVNVQKVLSSCRCKGSGTLCMRITDATLPQNDGVWRVHFAPGEANRVEATQEEPDVTMTVNDFSALIAGARGAEDIPWMPRVQVHHAGAPLKQVFYRKPCYIMDLF